MPKKTAATLTAALLGSAATGGAEQWRIHDMERPRPDVVAPAAEPGGAPGDAVVLFDGTDLSAWVGRDGGAAPWKVENGYVEVVPRSGPIRTRRSFGDCQLHIEWATPPPEGEGQGRGNSGVFLMGRYELQVLDSWENDTYPDGQAGAVYGQQPPMVNASRPPREWQSYDVVFRRPRFDAAGAVTSAARMTVFHNGVLVQDGTELTGPTDWLRRRPYQRHDDALPLELQDHGNPMRFRNIWIRELPAPRPQPAPVPVPPAEPAAGDLSRYTGRFEGGFEIALEDGRLWLRFGGDPITPLRRTGENSFAGETVGIDVAFSGEADAEGRPVPATLTIGRSERPLKRAP